MASPEQIGAYLQRTYGAHRADDYIITSVDSATANRLAGAFKADKVEIPPEVDRLIDNKMYRNRVRFLIRVHGVHYMIKCAELAQTKAKPSHWFAKAVISTRNWHERTLTMLEALFSTEGIVLKAVAGMSEQAQRFTHYVIGAIGYLGMGTFRDIMRRARQADDPERYMFGALRQAMQEQKGLIPS